MTILSLFIPDQALCEAVLEQITAAKLGAVSVCASAEKAAKITDGILMIDGDAAFVQSTAPTILMLGGKDDNTGVTETFAKPLRLGHLIARLRYYIETAPLLRDQTIEFGSYRLEPHKRQIVNMVNDEIIRLTEKETSLLVHIANAKQPATRGDILASVWGYDERIDTHTLETHIYQLRRKLTQDENWLINEAGGYRLAGGNK